MRGKRGRAPSGNLGEGEVERLPERHRGGRRENWKPFDHEQPHKGQKREVFRLEGNTRKSTAGKEGNKATNFHAKKEGTDSPSGNHPQDHFAEKGEKRRLLE